MKNRFYSKCSKLSPVEIHWYQIDTLSVAGKTITTGIFLTSFRAAAPDTRALNEVYPSDGVRRSHLGKKGVYGESTTNNTYLYLCTIFMLHAFEAHTSHGARTLAETALPARSLSSLSMGRRVSPSTTAIASHRDSRERPPRGYGTHYGVGYCFKDNDVPAAVNPTKS